MKQGIHTVYQEVIFKDMSTGAKFLVRSCAQTKDVDTWEDGKEYPLVKVEVTSASHPFFTGQEKLIDTQGRVERFQKKYAAKPGIKTPKPGSKA